MNYLEQIRQFRKLGCTDEAKCAVAAKIYLDLKEVVRLKNVEYHYDPEIDLIYLQNINEDGEIEKYLPICSPTRLDFKQLDVIQHKFRNEDKICNLRLAICDASSTILYYRLTKELK